MGWNSGDVYVLHGGFESKFGILWDYLDKRTFWICKVGVMAGGQVAAFRAAQGLLVMYRFWAQGFSGLGWFQNYRLRLKCYAGIGLWGLKLGRLLLRSCVSVQSSQILLHGARKGRGQTRKLQIRRILHS